MERMVRNGKRPPFTIDMKLTQLPRPDDCIISTARLPPRWAPQASATPSSSVVSATECTSLSAIERSMAMR